MNYVSSKMDDESFKGLYELFITENHKGKSPAMQEQEHSTMATSRIRIHLAALDDISQSYGQEPQD
jgi:hypothetical protein